MVQFTQHPTAKAFYERTRGASESDGPATIDADWLRRDFARCFPS